MGRHKKVNSETKSPKCASTRRMPATSGSGNTKETSKSKKKSTAGERKVNANGTGAGETSTGRGGVNPKAESAPPEDQGQGTTISTSTRIITTPSRYSFPFLRSTVKKPAKIQSSPPGPSQDKSKEKDKEKQGKAEQPKAERKRWEAWSNQDKNLFFEAVAEHGKDFESIQRYIGQRHKKLGYPPNQNKNKDQVRHLYYRTCHKLLKYVKPLPDQPRVNSELYALVNYGELRKKLKGGLTAKWGQKLNELVSQGSTSIRFKGRNLKLKTPVCKALKKLKGVDKNEEKPTKLPARVLLELQPRSNAAWAEVQGVAHNPRLRLVVPLQKDMGNLLRFLSEKWTPHRLRLLHSLKPEDKSNFNQVKIHLPKGSTVIPYKKLHGRFIHANSKTPFTLVATDQSPSKNESREVDLRGEDSKEDITDRILHPEFDNDIKMEVDLLDNHHPSETLLQETMPSMFSDGNSIGDLLSNMANGSLEQTNGNLSFSNLSLSLSTNQNSLLLAPPASNILMQHDSIETNNPASSSLVGPAGDGGVSNGVEQDSSDDCIKMDVIELEEEKKEMDELLKEGLTAATAVGMTATDIYLMMGQPEMLKFEYDFVKKEHPVHDVSSSHMMKKLLHLAKTSYVEVSNRKEYVSVGIVTSPIRTNTPPSKANQSCSTRSPSTNSRSPRGAGSKGTTRGNNPTTNPKNQTKSIIASKSDANDKKEGDEDGVHFAVPKAAAPVAARRNQEPSHAQEGQEVLNQLEQMKRPPANFLLPRMKKRQRGVKPLVVQRTILPRPLPQESLTDSMVSMAIINSSQANMGQFMPFKVNMSSLGTVVSPRALPRPIKPNVGGVSTNTIAGVGKTITKTVFAPPSGAAKTVVRRIIPVNITNSPENAGNLINSPVSFSPVHSPMMPSSPAPESQVNQVSTSQLSTSPSPSTASPQPLGSSTPARGSPHLGVADSSLLNATVTIDQGPATPAQPINNQVPGTPVQPINNQESSVLNTPIMVDKTHQSLPDMDSTLLGDSTFDQTLTPAVTVADSSLLNSSMACGVTSETTTTTHPTTPLISPPEISALLDISLPASESGDNISISLDSSTFKTFGQNISSISPNSTSNELLNSSTLSRDIGNVSPTSSPFKINSLGPEAQWFNGESLDISMSSLLGHLESPEKKEKNQPSTSTSVSVVPLSLPPGLLSESSRDSIITRDVDSTLQVMLNENSIDYVTKFAELAAHISATPDTPHKINIIEKTLSEESARTESGAHQLQLSSST
nr:protein cramped-like [Lytechinus pictus]